MKKQMLRVSFVAALAAFTSYGDSASAQEGTWEKGVPMNYARRSFGAATVGGKIYVIGGANFNWEDRVPNMEVYDSATQAWTVGPSMLTPRFGLAVVAMANKIYAAGCYPMEECGTVFEEYDIVSNSWQSRAPLPLEVANLASVALNGKVYILGGGHRNRQFSTLFEYDPATDRWTQRTSMNVERDGLAAVVCNDKIYAIGGYGHSGLNSSMEEYDPATDHWRFVAPMSEPRMLHAAAMLDGKIYAIGGIAPPLSIDDTLASVEEYDPTSDTWRIVKAMPTSRVYLAAASLDDNILAIGGTNNTVDPESLPLVEIYSPIPQVNFAVFNPRAEFTLGPKANDDSYWVRGWLKLANTSNGIDPLTEAVTIKVGPFSHTLPEGSFKQDGTSYLFKGPVGPSTLDVRITASSKPGGYSFKSCLKNGDLRATTFEPQVQLTIGDDSGQAALDVGYAKFGKGALGQNWVFPPVK